MVQIEIRQVLNTVVILGDDKKGKPFLDPPPGISPYTLEIDQPEGSKGDAWLRPGTGQGWKQGKGKKKRP
jgi:hypothetical protein